MIIFFSFCLSLLSFNSFAQDSIRISGKLINNSKYAKIVVQQFGIGSHDVAAIAIDKETGNFFINAPKEIPAGIYRFQYSQIEGDFVDVILNGNENEVQFLLDVNSEVYQRIPQFTKSEENIVWQKFNSQIKSMLKEIDVIDSFIGLYPNKKDSFYLQANKERIKKIQNYQKFRNDFINTVPYYFAKQLAIYTPFQFSNPTEDYRLQDFYKHDKYWEGKTTTEINLLNTPLYTDAILDYLKYYMNPDMGFAEKEMNEGFKKCVDTIMIRFAENDKTQEFAIKYLQMGFKELGNEELLKYIDEKYASTAQCTTGDDELQKRLKGYETLKIGNPAPEIILIAQDGSNKTLLDFTQEKVVLVFWASWCPHCMEELPKLEAWAKEQTQTLVLAVSLDEDYGAFQEAVQQFPSMLHYCDLQKWNGKIVSDYFVAATPTIIVLDQERKLLGKYANFSALSTP